MISTGITRLPVRPTSTRRGNNPIDTGTKTSPGGAKPAAPTTPPKTPRINPFQSH